MKRLQGKKMRELLDVVLFLNNLKFVNICICFRSLSVCFN